MLDGWTTPASGGVLWWGVFQASPSFPWADPHCCQHPAKRHTHAAQMIRIKKKKKERERASEREMERERSRLIFSRAPFHIQPVMRAGCRRMWNLCGGFMSHHKVCAHLKEILFSECPWDPGVCPNTPCISKQQAWSHRSPPWAETHDRYSRNFRERWHRLFLTPSSHGVEAVKSKQWGKFLFLFLNHYHWCTSNVSARHLN